MSKKKLSYNIKDPGIIRESLRHFYVNKYYNLWQNLLKWPDTIDYQQIDFVMRKLWETGSIAGWKNKPTGEQVFATFAAATYNTYDWPVGVNLINPRGVPFIPNTIQTIDKDVVIGYAQRNKKPIRETIEFFVDKIVNVEMTININLQVQKTPWIVAAESVYRDRVQEFLNKINNDEFALFLDVNEADTLKALQSGSQFVIDKLYSYKKSLENELNEYFGFDNMGVAEKKEHLINSEVEANNDLIRRSGECITDAIIDFFTRLKDFTGIDSIPWVNKPDDEQFDEEMGDELKDKDGEEDVV